MGARSVRHALVLAHRYAGLAMAAFLILEGVTGSILAYGGPITAFLAPASAPPRHPGCAPLGLGVLAQKAEAAEPAARVGYFWVSEGAATMRMQSRRHPGQEHPKDLAADTLTLDASTGQILARQRYGDLRQGGINVIPFIYEVHQNLALGPWGTILLGVVAVLWTIDCFIAVYLTLPTTAPKFLARWKTAWVVKRSRESFRLNFDLHRAGGLWLWPALFVFAWSSVMFTLPTQVYEPITGLVFRYESESDTFARLSRRKAVAAPRLNWVQAQAAGERLMAKAAHDAGLTIIRPYGMAYIPDWGVYTYAVHSDGDVMANAWSTSLFVDGDTGRLVEADLPTTRLPGNVVDDWMRALHFGDWGGSALYRFFVFLIGLATTGLSVTGVYIWLRKRSARAVGRSRRATAT